MNEDFNYARQVKITTTPPVYRTAATVVALLIIGSAGFAGGVQYQKHKTNSPDAASINGPDSRFPGQDGQSNGSGMGQGRMGSFGEVTAISSSSITVLNDRTSKSQTYKISSSTSVTDGTSTANLSDIQKGDTVMISTSSSSSTTATRIILNPQMGGSRGNMPGSSSTNNDTNSSDSI